MKLTNEVKMQLNAEWMLFNKAYRPKKSNLASVIKHLGNQHDQLAHSGGRGSTVTSGSSSGDQTDDKPQKGKGLKSHISMSTRKDKVWNGEPLPKAEKKLSKLQTGDIGERVALQVLQDKFGVQFGTVNVGVNNAPIDVAGDHMAVEVKTGLGSNGKSAQQWRATIGQPGKAETAALKKMSKEEKRAHNNFKKEKILERKQSMLKKMSDEAGEEIKPFTVTSILSPDGKSIDVYMLEGFHLRTTWKNGAIPENHLGSFDIEE